MEITRDEHGGQILSEVFISPDVYRLALNVEREFAAAQDEIAASLSESWKASVEAVGAVRTGNFRNSIGVRALVQSNSLRERMIDAPKATGYSDIVERGRRNANYPGRFPALRAILSSAPTIVRVLDKAGKNIGGA